MKLQRLGYILAAAGLLAASPSARAADVLTGIYEGKLSCKGLDSGAATKDKQDVTMDVVEGKGLVSIRITAGATPVGEVVRAFIVDDTNKADRAKIAGVDCGVEVVDMSGVVLQADAVVKEGSEKGTLKGTLTNSDFAGLDIEVCSFSVKRTSLTPPKFLFCTL